MRRFKNFATTGVLLVALVSCSDSSDMIHADLPESSNIPSQIAHGNSLLQEDSENSHGRVSDTFVDRNTIAADLEHIYGVQENGNVIATGTNREGELNISDWEKIVSVYADTSTAIGIAENGTIYSSGLELSESELAVMEGAISLDTKGYLIAVKEDGTIALPEYAKEKALEWVDDVSKWDDILKATSYGYEESAHIVGLKNDGTVVAAGNNEYGQCDVSSWKNIIAIDVGRDFTVGLHDDGTVVVAGKLTALELEDQHSIVTVDAATIGWTDIVMIAAGNSDNLVGLKADGTVVAVGFDLSDWKDIAAIDITDYAAIGLKSDGTVIVETNNESKQWWEESEWDYCTDTWKDIRMPE